MIQKPQGEQAEINKGRDKHDLNYRFDYINVLTTPTEL